MDAAWQARGFGKSLPRSTPPAQLATAGFLMYRCILPVSLLLPLVTTPCLHSFSSVNLLLLIALLRALLSADVEGVLQNGGVAASPRQALPESLCLLRRSPQRPSSATANFFRHPLVKFIGHAGMPWRAVGGKWRVRWREKGSIGLGCMPCSAVGGKSACPMNVNPSRCCR